MRSCITPTQVAPSSEFARATLKTIAKAKVIVFPAAVLMLCWGFSVESAMAQSFAPGVTYGTGSFPQSVAVGDFNGDGKADLVTANFSGNSVSVLLNNGDGTFAAKVDYATGMHPFSVAVGDFNNDGKPDLATANFSSNTVSVLINNGSGTFAAKVDYVTGAGPFAVAVGDFNLDGKLDLAATNRSSGTVSVFLNNGAGTFAAKVDYATGGAPQGLAVGDFNLDGKPDLAVANFNDSTVSVLINNGSGTFAAKVDYPTGGFPNSVAVGDFNLDGRPDLVVANNGSTVSVLINNGNGTFAAKVDYDTDTTPNSVAVGDFNLDGKPDLVTSNANANNASVLINNGDGTFAAKVDFGPGSAPASVAVGDFNTDGKPDLALLNSGSNTVGVFINTAPVQAGFFGAPINKATGLGPIAIAVGDFNLDGKPDVATANSNGNTVSVLLNNGNGTFATKVDYATGSVPYSVAVGDFNRDGRPDLAVTNFTSNTVSVFINNGDGTFATKVDHGTGPGPVSVAVGDFNLDGKPDLAVANSNGNTMSVLLNNGAGVFAPKVDYITGSAPFSVAVGDFNLDGKLDLAVANNGSDTVSVFLNAGSGTFAAKVDYSTGAGSAPESVAVGDFNLDGKPDLAVANIGANNVSVLLNNGSGTFAAHVDYGTGVSPNWVTIGDFNLDGKLDLATANTSGHNASVLINNGGGTFAAKVDYELGLGSGPEAVAVGDFNLDGKPDLAVANGSNNTVSELLNRAMPTAVKLVSFTAAADDGGRMLLKWQTGFEVDNLGFNIYREQGGIRTRITPQLVAGSALTDGPGTSLLSGHTYYWADTPPEAESVRYRLEDIDLNSKSTLNGPYSIIAARPGSVADAQKQSELISQIGMRQALLANGLGSTPLTRVATLATPSAATLQLQSGLASQPAVKIAVKQEGYYRVTQAELLRAGLDAKVDPRLLRLFVDGIELPIKVTGEQDGRFDANDAVEFYGVGLDTASADTRVYWLVAGTQPGKRIAITRGKGDPIASGGFPFTVERKDRTIYFSALRNGDAENFFGAVVASQPVDQPLWIQHLDQTSQTPASIEVSLQGVTTLAHNVRVQLNGTDVTRLNFTGQAPGKALVSISQSLLREGENTVRLIAEGGLSDVSLVDVIQISYSHSYLADSNTLRLTAQAGQQVSISGFTGKDIRLMDVTDVNAPEEIAATVTGSNNGYTLSGAVVGSGNHLLLAFADSQAQHPWSITADQPSNLRQPGNGADVLIITQRDFFSTIDSLKTLRQSQGLSVAVVDVEDIYDEFSFGDKSPQAVKDFLAYAATDWKKKPRFVLLGGDASYDPKNYLGLGSFDLVPTKLLDTAYMETASDDWFADFDNDGVPELAVGRLPFRSTAVASAMIAKIIGYERSTPSEEVLLVADSNDGFDFEQASAQLVGMMPESLKINQINRGTDTAASKELLMEAVNRGQKLVNYAGHGSVNQWRGNLLVNEDASQMKNTDHLSVFVMMTCLNGYFDDPALDSLAASLMKAANGGAVAVWASSGMTEPQEQAMMNRRLYSALFGGGNIQALGEATRAAIMDIDIRRTWLLFGDPTMKLR